MALLDQAFNQHRPGKDAEKYISSDTCIQHNPNFGNGRDAFVTGVTGYLQQFPDASLTFKRTVTQGDLVVVQGLAKASAEDRGTVEVDTFRFDRRGRIVGTGTPSKRSRRRAPTATRRSDPPGPPRRPHLRGEGAAFCAVPGRTDQKG